MDEPQAKNLYLKYNKKEKKRENKGDFPGGAVVENPPASAGLVVQSLVRGDARCRGTMTGAHSCWRPGSARRSPSRHRRAAPVSTPGEARAQQRGPSAAEGEDTECLERVK